MSSLRDFLVVAVLVCCPHIAFQQCVFSQETSEHPQLPLILGPSAERDQDAIYPEGSEQSARRLYSIGESLHADFRLLDSLDAHQRALKIRRKLYPPANFPKGHPSVAESLCALGAVLTDLGRYPEAKDVLEESLKIRESVFPSSVFPSGNLSVASSLTELGWMHNKAGSFDDAVSLLKKSFAIHETLHNTSAFPSGSGQMVDVANDIGHVLHNGLDNTVEAVSWHQRALKMCLKLYPKSLFPSGNERLARTHHLLGCAQRDQNHTDEASRNLEIALATRRHVYSASHFKNGHPELAETLEELGFLHQLLGEYDKAEPLQLEALQMYEAMFPAEEFPDGHPEVASCLNDTAYLYQDMGKYSVAEELFQDAAKVFRRTYSDSKYKSGHPDLATGISNLAHIKQIQGKYGEARKLNEQAIESYRKLYPKARFPRGHLQISTSLNNLANLLYVTGDYERSKAIYLESLDMRQRLFPETEFPHGHGRIATSLSNLSAVYLGQRDFENALDLATKALDMRRDLLKSMNRDQTHPIVVQSINNIGHILQQSGEHKAALEKHLEAKEMLEALYEENPQHPELVAGLSNLGEAYREVGEYEEAETLLADVLAKRKITFPIDEYPIGHPNIASALYDLALLKWQKGSEDAAEFALASVDMYSKLCDSFYSEASEAESLNYLARLPTSRDLLLSITVGQKFLDRSIFEHVSLTESAVTRHQEVRAEFAASSSAKLDLLKVRQELSRLLRAPLKNEQLHKERIQLLSGAKESLERDLVNQIGKVELSSVEPDVLQAALPDESVYVSFFKYTYIDRGPRGEASEDNRDESRYCAFVISKKLPITRVELGDADDVDASIRDWLTCFEPRNLVSEKQSPTALICRKAVWDPLQDAIPRGTTHVFIRPDALLSNVPFVAFPGESTDSFLVDQISFSYVMHSQHLIDALGRPAGLPEAAKALVVSNVNYSEPPDNNGGLAAPISLATAELEKHASRVPLPSVELTQLGKEVLNPLSGDGVLKAMRSHLGPDRVVPLTLRQASTARCLAEIPRFQLIHFATHGLYRASEPMSAAQERVSITQRNPLAFCGLALSGANMEPNIDDLGLPIDDGGILTGEAIAGLNLDNLEIAVLSACGTNVGEIAIGEGAYSMQRAFCLSGAKSVVASRWSVDNEATEALMKQFYKNLLFEGKNKAESLQAAQLWMLKDFKPKKKRVDGTNGQIRGTRKAEVSSPLLSNSVVTSGDTKEGRLHPYFWAGFSLCGKVGSNLKLGFPEADHTKGPTKAR